MMLYLSLLHVVGAALLTGVDEETGEGVIVVVIERGSGLFITPLPSAVSQSNTHPHTPSH